MKMGETQERRARVGGRMTRQEDLTHTHTQRKKSQHYIRVLGDEEAMERRMEMSSLISR